MRKRVSRAAELGLDYRTYASVRAASGHDVVAFLFSSNALRVMPGQDLPEDRAGKLRRLCAGRIGLAQGRLAPEALLAAAEGVLDAAHPAPRPFAGWSESRARLRAALGRIPSDQVILVGEGWSEREWSEAARLAACPRCRALHGRGLRRGLGRPGATPEEAPDPSPERGRERHARVPVDGTVPAGVHRSDEDRPRKSPA